ncbi:hypothetical protein FHT77_003106 [Rhizobium sp. BK181]|nr:hypothetical protein [Rhizobium sp. BK181]
MPSAPVSNRRHALHPQSVDPRWLSAIGVEWLRMVELGPGESSKSRVHGDDVDHAFDWECWIGQAIESRWVVQSLG